MDISIVISIFNEEESLPELINWINRVVNPMALNYELVLIDDGSSDGSWEIIQSFANQQDNIRAIKFRRNYGKSAALYCGFETAKGNVVITMDADLQDSPEEIPELYRMITEEKYDLVSGWKRKRYDPISKTLPTKIYNWTARKMTGLKLHDMNCGLKAYRNKVIKSIEVYGEMHRYIPVLAKNAGFRRIGEKEVIHQKRKYGYSKFGLERFVNGYLDLMSVLFIGKFIKRPMHFFGLLGSLSFVAGVVVLTILSIQKIFFDVHKIASRPMFFFGFLAIIFGTQLFLTGFLAELVTRSSPERNKYIIDERI